MSRDELSRTGQQSQRKIGPIWIALLGTAGLLLFGLSQTMSWQLVWAMAKNGIIFFLASLILGILLRSLVRSGQTALHRFGGAMLGVIIGVPALAVAYFYLVAPLLLVSENPIASPVMHGLLALAVLLGYWTGFQRVDPLR